MQDKRTRFWAIAETVVVLAIVVVGLKAVGASPLGDWGRRTAAMPAAEYALVLAIAAAASFLRRESLAAGGLRWPISREQLRLAAGGALPVLAISAALFWLGWDTWGKAVAISALEVAVLCLVGWLSKRMGAGEGPAGASLALLVPGTLLLAAQGTASPSPPLRLLATFALVAPAEELLFRGYVQSRLNEAFGRPRSLLGARWGWGLVLASLLFGLWHVLNPFNPFAGSVELAWTWGLWTTFLGLLLGWARERSGGLLAPWLWHGLINL